LAVPRGALLVNVARGGVVVEAELVSALRDGALARVALDAFDREPSPADHPLLSMDNVIVTPHCASTAFENSSGERHWLGNILRISRGEPIPKAAWPFDASRLLRSCCFGMPI
jgi:phosphoglycerate dehydrogenase-like enzyme